jgi:hypothetical protein
MTLPTTRAPRPGETDARGLALGTAHIAVSTDGASPDLNTPA